MTGTSRHLALLLCCLPMAGCGFHPLHGGGAHSVDAQLPDIFVANIPGRTGQQLRQSLQQRLAGSSEASPQGYTLQVSYVLSSEALGIHGDNTSSRNRVIGSANWVLSSVAPAPVALASGNARSVDGFNIIETQYFAATLANETTGGRVADNLADTITTQIATWFTAHPTGTGGDGSASVKPATPNIGPGTGFLGPQNVPGENDVSPLQPISPDGLPSGAIGRTTR